MNLKRIAKYNFYKMEIKPDVIFHGCKVLSKHKAISVEDFKSEFQKGIYQKLNQSNYPVTLVNFLSYYGLISKRGAKGKEIIDVVNHPLISDASQSYEKAAVLMTKLLNFELGNLDTHFIVDVEKIISRMKRGETLLNSEIVDLFKHWSKVQPNKRLQKDNTKDTAYMFSALVIAKAHSEGMKLTFAVSSPYTYYSSSHKNHNSNFEYSNSEKEFVLYMTKMFKANAKKTEGRTDFTFDAEKFFAELNSFEEEIQKREDYIEEHFKQNKVENVRNSKIRERAFEKYGRFCNVNRDHKTFVLESGLEYVESHHMILLSSYESVGLKKEDLDVVDNIIPLCPLCHKLVHIGAITHKRDTVEKMWDLINERGLSNVISKQKFLAQYNVVELTED